MPARPGSPQPVNVALLRLAQREFGSGMPAEHIDATLARIIDPIRPCASSSPAPWPSPPGSANDPDTERLWAESAELRPAIAPPLHGLRGAQQHRVGGGRER